MSGRGFKQVKKLSQRSRDQRGGNKSSNDGLERKGPDCLAALYLEYLERLAVLNYSPTTLEGFKSHLIAFLKWSQQRDLQKPAEITKPILESYQRTLYRYRKKNGTPLSYSMQSGRIGAVKGFFKWLCRSNYALWNPASELELMRPEKRLPKTILTADEVEQVMNQPDLHDLLGIRDRAILELLYSTGMRRIELVKLAIDDLDRGRSLIRLRLGKGKKDRVVPIGNRAFEWVEHYMEEVRPKLSLSMQEKALFLTGYAEAFHPDYLTRTVSRYIDKADLGKRGSCHLLRHTCATLMLENGADIRYIQQLLGHSNLETTEIYTRVSIKQLQKVHQMTHPAEEKLRRVKSEV